MVPSRESRQAGTRQTTRSSHAKHRRTRVRRPFRRRLLRVSAGIGGSFGLLLGAVTAIAFGTPFGAHMRMIAAETVITTRHYYLARYLTTPSEYALLLKQLNTPVVNTGVTHHVAKVQPIQQQAIAPVGVKAISGPGWNGYAVFVHNPRMLRLVHANVQGAMGEYITAMGKRVGAVAGINASGFADPNGNGWGGLAVGMEYVSGHVISHSPGAESWPVVGFTSAGDMVMGNYTPSQLQSMGVRDAMQFHPELVVNGKPTITYGDGGWGYDPRTAIGQEKDGTVIFIVTNGRFHGGAGMGASQRQVMDLMLKYGAVNACAMDGGSSSVLYDNGKILNSPSTIDPNGQRHLPDAWMVFPTAAAASSYSP